MQLRLTEPDSRPPFPPAESLLKSSQGQRLTDFEKRYIEECLKEPFSFFEIVDCTPGQGFKLIDVISGRTLDVIERKGSQNAHLGNILFGKPVTIEGLTTMEATSSILIPSTYKQRLIDFRNFLKKHKIQISLETLRDYDIELIEIYQSLWESLMSRASPQLTNTDGDRLVPQRIFFDIDSPHEAFDALHSLNFKETKDFLLETAMLDASQKVQKVSLSWLRAGNKLHKSWDNTVLGHIEINGQTLTADINSMERAEEFRREVEKRLGNRARYKTTMIESIEPKLEEIKKKSISRVPKLDDENDEDLDQEQLLEQHPELRERMESMMKAHWNEWIHVKVPALGNKTPLQASKTKDGREMLQALLTDFERHAVSKSQPGTSLEIFEDIRRKLGLANALRE